MSVLVLKRLLLYFWAAWLAIVTASNVCDAFKAFEVLDKRWPFASGNYNLVVKSVARYGAGSAVGGGLFGAVIAWEAISAVLFLHAAINFKSGDDLKRTYAAFIASLALWAAFMLADEIVMEFAIETTHMRIFIAQLASLLVIRLIPAEVIESSENT
jgi:hypothetical protein